MNRRYLLIMTVFAFSLMLLIGILSVIAIPSSSSIAAVDSDGRLVGQVRLAYPNEVYHTVYIEDISPDLGSSAQDETTSRYGSRWGMMNALSVSPAQFVASPACNYTSDNAGTLVEHIAAVDPDGSLISFYYSDDNDWKAVNIAEKTGIPVAQEQPACWTAPTDSALLENIAARQSGGHVYVFTWQAGSDWVATNLSSMLGYYAVSPVTSWNAAAGTAVAEHVAFRTQDSDLVLYWRIAGQNWAAVNVTNKTAKKVAGTPTGWNMSSNSEVERLAITDSNQHLIVFTYTPSSDWSFSDVSALVGGNPTVQGRVSAWDLGGIQYIAARNTDNHLLVFRFDPIESNWYVADITAQTGQNIANDPVSWMTGTSGNETFHIAAPDDTGHIRHFYRLASTSSWNVEDITNASGESTFLPMTAWVHPDPSGQIQRLAGPDPNGYLHVQSLASSGSWTAVDVSTRSAGRIVFAGAPFAGVWSSRDYGVNWNQSTRPQPEESDTQVPGALNTIQVLDLIVSPSDYNRVIALANRENRTEAATQAGVYVSQDGGDQWELKYQFNCSWGIEGPSQVVVAPDDPQRFYVAGGCGIARSNDGGLTWTRIMTTTNNNQHVWHLITSGQTGSSTTNRTLVACGDGNLWASKDDGQHWYLDSGATQHLPGNFCGKTAWGHGNAAHILALVPNNPSKVYLAFDHDANGPSYFHPTSHGEGGDGTFCNNPVVYDTNGDNQFDSSDSELWGRTPVEGATLADDVHLKFRDLDKDGQLDPNEVVVNDANNNDTYDKDEIILRQDNGNLAVGDPLNDDNRIRYVDEGRAFGTRGCGEGSLWKGDLSAVLNQTGLMQGSWSQLPGPPVYWGAGDSGAAYVFTHPTPSGYLTFFSDQATVHVAEGEPSTTGWHRLDGANASSINRSGGSSQQTYMHVDPQGFTLSSDFDLSLKTVRDRPFPYDQNSELHICGGGRLWFSNDGGVYHSDDCGTSMASWHPAASGLNTLAAVNIQGTTSLDYTPALYFGAGDNDDFYSMDDGKTWQSAAGMSCGDCDVWYGDLYQVNRILRLQPRANNGAGAFDLFTNPSMNRPDAGQASQLATVNYPNGVRPYAVSHLVLRGYRPVIQTVPTATPPADGDYVAIQAADANLHYLMRANDQLSSSGLDRYGAQIPTLAPNNIPNQRDLWVQTSGGHNRTEFYLGDGVNLWYGVDPISSWQLLVPTGTLTAALRYFVNPYNPAMVYMITPQGIFLTNDHGSSWQSDDNLQRAVTANSTWKVSCGSGTDCLINDMVFDPTLADRRFAAGPAGVFFTVDGENWLRLLDTRAIPSLPRALWFDPISHAEDDGLYVAMDGRGILRLHPIPRNAPLVPGVQPPPAPTPTPSPTPSPPGSGLDIINNGGFEDGVTGWNFYGGAGLATSMAHNGNNSAQLGHENILVDELSQSVMMPCELEAVWLSYYTNISSMDNHPSMDTFSVSVESQGQGLMLQSLTEESPQGSWYHALYDLSDYRCQELTIKFQSIQNGQLLTAFYVDDVSLRVFDGNYYLILPLMER